MLRLLPAIRGCSHSSTKSKPSTRHRFAVRFLSSTHHRAGFINIPEPNTSRSTSSSQSLGSLGRSIAPLASETGKASGFGAFYDKITVPQHHLHVYAHRQNTHITLTDHRRHPIISISCGNIGFRKAARGTFDAAHQLGMYMINRIALDGWLTKIQRLELILRGFGPGREAISKLLMGKDGAMLRPLFFKVTDATRLKFGGTRSPKPRRL